MTVPGVMEQLPRYLNGDVRVSEHSMLKAEVYRRNPTDAEAPASQGPYHALNDAGIVAKPSL